MRRILLVDDDVDLADLVKTKLVAEGYDVHVTNTGEDGFELAKRLKPAIAILDIMLPGTTGYQIARRIRKDPELYRIGILLMTALGEEPEIAHGLEQGADDYIVKPFKLDKLQAKLASLEAMLDSIGRRNPVTNLPNTDAAKREINHRLARETATAACYIDLVGFKAYCASKGREGQQRALQFTSNLLSSLVRDMGVYESTLAHMGGEHFVVVLNLDDYKRFCHTLTQTFDQRVRELYTHREMTQGYITAVDRRQREVRCPLMALAVGVAHTKYRTFKSAKKVFEVLAQCRQMATPDKGSVYFVDRRRTDR